MRDTRNAMLNKSPINYLRRLQSKAQPSMNPNKNYPNIFPKTRLGQVKWYSDKDYERLTNSLLEKEHVVIS